MSRLVDFIKGVGSLALSVILLIGIPAALIALIGFPFPTEMPQLDLIQRHIQDADIPDEFVVKTLALLVWFVWAQLAIGFVTESIAVARGRAANRAPIVPGIQLVARKLVASSVLIISVLSPAKGAIAAPLMPIDATEVSAFDAGQVSEVDEFSKVKSAGVSAKGQYETQKGDNWWEMAEKLLGDGMRWSELRDLNSGKTMLTGDVVNQNTETVKPGWHLDVPADAESSLLGVFADAGYATPGPGPAGAERPATLIYEGPTGNRYLGSDAVPYQVVEGDNLWDIAEAYLGDGSRWQEIYESSTELNQGFDRSLSDPNIIWPDDIVLLPPDAQGVPTPDSGRMQDVIGVKQVDELPSPELPAEVPAQPDRAVTEISSPARVADTAPTAVESDSSLLRSLLSPVGAAFGAGGLFVASGLLGMLMRARHRRLSEAGAGAVPAPPPMDLVDLETVLRNRSNRAAALSIHTTVQSLTSRVVQPGEPVVGLEVVRISGDRVEVVQDRPDPELPSPWLTSAPVDWLDGRSIAVLPAEFFPNEPTDEQQKNKAALTAPLFVTVGGGLLLNLESVGVTLIDGPVELSAGLIRSMVHELATGPARRSIDIRVSSWLPGADLHERVRCAPVDRLVDELGAWVEQAELSLTSSGFGTSFAMRVAGYGDGSLGSKVIFADVADAPALAPLLNTAMRKRLPLAVVLSGDIATLDLPAFGIQDAVEVNVAEEILELRPYGFKAAMQYLDVDLVLGTESLIRYAEESPLVHQETLVGVLDNAAAISDVPTDPAQRQTERTPAGDVITEQPEQEHEITDQDQGGEGLFVRVLGPVEVEGASASLSDAAQSVITFLAIAGPSTADQLATAIWPAQVENQLSEVVAELEQKLGSQFQLSTDGRYRLRSVITDLGSARRWLAQAQGMTDDRARNLMQLALSEVRGRPFERAPEQHWQWIADHQMAIATQATAMIIDACFDLCDNAYSVDDLHLAKWACEVGLVVDPMQETVVERRVQLLMTMGLYDEATSVVDQWEVLYAATVDRPAPYGPRMALGTDQATPYVG